MIYLFPPRCTSEYHLYHIGNLIREYSPIATGIEVTGGTGQVYLENLQSTLIFNKFHAIKTTGDSKPVMLDRFKLLMEKQQFIYPQNSPIVDELLNFKRNESKLEAAQGKHDDIVMAVSFALAIANKEEYL